ncbi:MAG: glycine--tRNA ligase subunit beta [Deltaproteobacteria bacterium]|nr:glycine--tRNA ligase subunit beta [Deltaproteobacteria bacterium]
MAAAYELLFEIGTEEIPAGLLAKALVDLREIASERLKAARLGHGVVTTFGTPRRIVLSVADLADRQADVAELMTGPPAKAAFDAEGKPTKAALGFAQKMGVSPSELTVTEVPGKGAYVAARREEKGAMTRALLPKLLADMTRAIPWKKAMRWGTLDEPFVRPVHWLVALYGGEVVPLELFALPSGRTTRGHRFLSPGVILLDGTLADYMSKLRGAFVIVDPEARRTMIEAELVRIQGEANVRVRPDPPLLAEVTNLVEYPRAICGSFADRYLEVPEEVIVSAMRAHQRYFATENAGGTLASKFVTISGTLVADPDMVRHGNERVLAARLADAKFFFDEDLRTTLEDFAAKLDGVVFQAKLGSVGEKVARVRQSVVAARAGVDRAKFDRAALLAKADLVTKMVGEFPDLQGKMGQHYARLAGEDPEVAAAIFEHYLPRGAQDRLPSGALGAAVGVADRMDTIVGCFAVGLAPTGSADAFGLRRASLAVLHVLLDRKWPVTLGALLDSAIGELAPKVPWVRDVRQQVLEFFATRLRGLLIEVKKIPPDCADAALAAGFEDVPDAFERAKAVARLRERPDFEPLAIAFKRVANILKGEAPRGEPEPAKFTHPSETALWESLGTIRRRVEDFIAERRYDMALRELASLKPSVDKFFDEVLVMDKDPAIKNNRLALLGAINALFAKIADFRQLSVQA